MKKNASIINMQTSVYNMFLQVRVTAVACFPSFFFFVSRRKMSYMYTYFYHETLFEDLKNIMNFKMPS